MHDGFINVYITMPSSIQEGTSVNECQIRIENKNLEMLGKKFCRSSSMNPEQHIFPEGEPKTGSGGFKDLISLIKH